MIPHYWLPVNRIPTQPSGKVDRKGLRGLLTVHPFRLNGDASPSSPGKEPRDRCYCDVRDAWSTILRVPATSIRDDDHFTRLGGDSIAFIRVVSLLRRQGYLVTFPELAGADVSTLRSCATRLREVTTERGRSTSIGDVYEPFSLIRDDRQRILTELEDELGVRPEEVEDVLPTSPAQDALLAPSVDSTNYFAQAVYPIHGDVNATALANALGKLVEREPMLRTAFALLEGCPKTLQIRYKPQAKALRNTHCRVVQVDDVDTSIKVETVLQKSPTLELKRWI
jgi:aryl carrier-like protein